jgi:hypothetical protein
MIKLINLLFEDIDYGERLFADPEDAWKVDPDLIKPFEPNTEQEKQLLKALQDYFRQPSSKIDPKMLEDLYKLRDKFPKILKPKPDIENVYRGATIDLPTVMSAKWIKYSYGYYTTDITTVKSRREGFISVSTNEAEARFFAGQNQDTKDRIAVIYDIPVKQNKVLFNTDFTNGLSRFSEDEMLLLTTGGKFAVEEVTIQNAHLKAFRFIKPEPGDPEFEMYQAVKHITGED